MATAPTGLFIRPARQSRTCRRAPALRTLCGSHPSPRQSRSARWMEFPAMNSRPPTRSARHTVRTKRRSASGTPFAARNRTLIKRQLRRADVDFVLDAFPAALRSHQNGRVVGVHIRTFQLAEDVAANRAGPLHPKDNHAFRKIEREKLGSLRRSGV